MGPIKHKAGAELEGPFRLESRNDEGEMLSPKLLLDLVGSTVVFDESVESLDVFTRGAGALELNS